MKIIKQGKYFFKTQILKCNNCDCEFEVENEGVYKHFNAFGELRDMLVSCPVCHVLKHIKIGKIPEKQEIN